MATLSRKQVASRIFLSRTCRSKSGLVAGFENQARRHGTSGGATDALRSLLSSSESELRLRSRIAELGTNGGSLVLRMCRTDSRSRPRASAKRTAFFWWGVPGGVCVVFKDELRLYLGESTRRKSNSRSSVTR